MFKKIIIKKIAIAISAILIVVLFCLFPSGNISDIPEEVLFVDELVMPIYLVDQNNYVARTDIIKANDSEDIIEYIIGALTIDSKSAPLLPVGFYSVIPMNTNLIDYSLKDGLLKLNFSKDFLTVNSDNEEKMIESLIYSLCELETVNQLMIFVEGQNLLKLPNSQKELPIVLDKNYGINKVYEFDDIKNTTKTTIYYLSKYYDNLYHVPITKITNSKAEHIEVIINELKAAPIHETNLISYLNASYELKDYEILENSITLSFNNALIASIDEQSIVEEVKYSISLSIRDTYNINDIVINMN